MMSRNSSHLMTLQTAKRKSRLITARKNYRRYIKSLYQQVSSISCPDCKDSVAARRFEKHCLIYHSFNAKISCVWCNGRYSWGLGRKHYHVDHLKHCMERFILLDRNVRVSFKHKPNCHAIIDFESFLNKIKLENVSVDYQTRQTYLNKVAENSEPESTVPAISATDCESFLKRISIEPAENFFSPQSADDLTRLYNLYDISSETQPTFHVTNHNHITNSVTDYDNPQSLYNPITLTDLNNVVDSEAEFLPSYSADYERFLNILSTEPAETIFESISQLDQAKLNNLIFYLNELNGFEFDYDIMEKRLEQLEKDNKELEKDNNKILEELQEWEDDYYTFVINV